MKKDAIKDYWQQSPPFKAAGKYGTREWSESITKHRHEVVPYLKDFLDSTRWFKKRVLEIGYGSGSDLLELSKAGATVYGVDITSKAKKLTQDRFKAEGLEPPTIVTYDGKTLGFPSGVFDMVYSCGVLHHSPYMDHLFSEINRVLVPGGLFKTMLYNRNSLLYHYSILYRAYMTEKAQIATGKKRTIEAANHPAMTALWSEFRTGCPLTNVYSEADIKDRLRYFNHVTTFCDYFVYDDFIKGVRKKDGMEFLSNTDTEKETGMPVLDKLFSEMRVVSNYQIGTNSTYYRGVKQMLSRKYGWHLLVDAIK